MSLFDENSFAESNVPELALRLRAELNTAASKHINQGMLVSLLVDDEVISDSSSLDND